MIVYFVRLHRVYMTIQIINIISRFSNPWNVNKLSNTSVEFSPASSLTFDWDTAADESRC